MKPLAALLLGGLAGSAAAGLPAHSSLQPKEMTALQFHPHAGASLPLGAAFRDSDGRALRLGELFHGMPAVLILEYLRCSNLCGVALRDLGATLAHVPLRPAQDYQVIAISIDPRDNPAAARAAQVKYAPAAAGGGRPGWHFLTGDARAIAAVADAVGFPFRYDPQLDAYAHPAGIVVATPAGRISRYLLGADYRPMDVRLALTEAASGTITSPVSRLLLLCYCYDPGTGRYSFAIRNLTRALCVATLLGLAAMLLRLQQTRRR